MSKPTVGCRSVPVLDVGGDMDYRAWQDLNRRFPFLLIPSATGNTDEHLTAAACSTMYMPVVATTRLKSDIREGYLRVGDTGKVTVALKISGVCRVRLANREYHFLLKTFFLIYRICRICPDLFGHTETGPCVGPSGIKSRLCQQCSDLLAGNPVLLAHFEV